jgi:acetyl-CoA acetyltransferase
VSWEQRGQAAFAGVGHSRIARRWDGSPAGSLAALTAEAVASALDDCGLKPADLDGIFCAPHSFDPWAPRPVPPGMDAYQMTGDPEDGISKISARWIGRNLGIAPDALHRDMASMFELTPAAVDAVCAGACSTALVVRALASLPGRYSESGAVSQPEVRGDLQYELPYGCAGSAYHALYFQRYLYRYGLAHEDLAPYAVKNRAAGLRAPFGYYYQFKPEPLTAGEYLSAKWIIEPVCLYDCDLPIMVAAAFVITTAERAATLRQPPVYVLGQGGIGPAPRSASYPYEAFEADNAAEARRIWSKAGAGPGDLDLANLYDGYLTIAPHWAEAFGLCAAGEGIAYLSTDNSSVTGRLPSQTCGGSNGVGRSHGAAHLYETVRQLRGTGGDRQVPGAETGLVVLGPPTARAGVGWAAHVLGRNR